MINLKRIKTYKKLYHLSLHNHNGKIFHPRVPDNCCLGEDDTYNRVCFSSSMSGAFRAISQEHYNDHICYVHVPDNIDSLIKRGSIYKPDDELVPDVMVTDEHWIRRPVKMKCIGKARFVYTNDYYWDRPRVYIKWIEKY